MSWKNQDFLHVPAPHYREWTVWRDMFAEKELETEVLELITDVCPGLGNRE